MSESGSDYSEPAESPIQGDDPTGSVSVWNENGLAFGPEADVARKLPGAVQNSLRGANEQNVSETPPPKRPSNGSSKEALDLHETSAAKESENLGSVRLALHRRLSSRALSELTRAVLWAFTLPDEVSLRHSKLQPLSLTEDRANPFQAALLDAKKESFRAGKVTVSNEVPPLPRPTRSTLCRHAVNSLKIF